MDVVGRPVLIIDDLPGSSWNIGKKLEREGYKAHYFRFSTINECVSQCSKILNNEQQFAIILDINHSDKPFGGMWVYNKLVETGWSKKWDNVIAYTIYADNGFGSDSTIDGERTNDLLDSFLLRVFTDTVDIPKENILSSVVSKKHEALVSRLKFLENNPSSKSNFFPRLPSISKRSLRQHNTSSKANVLIIDLNEGIADLQSEVLRSDDFDVTVINLVPGNSIDAVIEELDDSFFDFLLLNLYIPYDTARYKDARWGLIFVHNELVRRGLGNHWGETVIPIRTGLGIESINDILLINPSHDIETLSPDAIILKTFLDAAGIPLMNLAIQSALNDMRPLLHKINELLNE